MFYCGLPSRILKTALVLIALSVVIAPADVRAQSVPFQFQADLELSDGQAGDASAPIPVPPGMRLVIETVTERVQTGLNPREPVVVVETVLNGAVVEHELAVRRVRDGFLTDTWTGTHAVRLYTSAADPGRGADAPRVLVRRSLGSTGFINARITISGLLVPEGGGL